MDKIENTIEELFNKPDWTDKEWALFLDLVEKESPEAMQYIFQGNFMSKLQQGDSRSSAKARQLLNQIHTRAGIQNQPAQVRSIKRLSFIRVAAAAAIFLLLSVGGYFYFNSKTLRHARSDNAIAKTYDVKAPASNKATLTLANGKQITLDSSNNGTLAKEGNINVIKLADGQITYNGTSSEIQYNTLNNPRGSKVINIVLNDGSKVWLNAESSLKYPTAFSGNERKVEITGEAYFEVTHNAAMPFVVQKNDLSVQVLGTHFNVNTYDDESEIKVTLLEGSVKVANGQSSAILKPGQQAKTRRSGDFAISNDVDIEEVMAWKNGIFRFRDTNIQDIMRQVARWYDVEIEYKGNFADLDFGGTVSRKANVSELLKRLEATEAVHFSIDGRKITVRH